jgi:hypothetical protein
LKTCAVIIAAYKAERWINAALESVQGQRMPPGWKLRVMVGVDGCEATSGVLRASGVAHYWSAENVGAYVMRNSLIGLHPSDAYAIFDADDIMLPGYLEALIPAAGQRGIAGAGRVTIHEDGRPNGTRPLPYVWGVSVISHTAWCRTGGYQPWRITADSDLIRRAKALGIRVVSDARGLYQRRKHPGSLTQAEETSMKSELRASLKAQTMADVAAGRLTVEPVTVELERRG